MNAGGAGPSVAVSEALRALDVRRLTLAIHDASFPGGSPDDLGYGAPASAPGRRLAAFARTAGFTALQLGPQGLTDEDDASPYMGALFSRNPLSIPLGRLADPDGEWGELLPRARLESLVAVRPPEVARRVDYPSAYRAQRDALGAAFEGFARRLAAGEAGARDLAARIERWRAGAGAWLEADALYEVLRGQYGGRDWPHWQGPAAERDRGLGEAAGGGAEKAARRAELLHRFDPAIRFYVFTQYLAHAQHRAFRDEAHAIGLALYGDLQVGVSPRDTWRHPGIFLDGYCMGAPPSRTNPDGQPWDYPVLDPDAYWSGGPGGSGGSGGPGDGPGPALAFLRARAEKMWTEFDAVRIDHPQGLVCPWVYRADDPDALHAVQHGARLFSSPDLEDHPALSRYAIPRRGQLARDPSVARYADGWVAELEPEQVDRYALLFDAVVAVATGPDGSAEPRLFCEVLSTLPMPLARVLARHDLGRFRVTQKADLSDPNDVYLASNAEPHDWIMFGNHDTPPLWNLLARWEGEGAIAARAAHAAERLEPAFARREPFAARLAAEPGLLAQAEIAQLLASPARNVSIFFADLFGMTEIYNRPGTVSPENWTLRLPPDWRARYEERLAVDRALNLPLALWWALRAKPGLAPRELVAALRAEAERPRRGTPLED